MSSRTLYILTPHSGLTPANLAKQRVLLSEDVIADFRQYPFNVYEFGSEHACQNITFKLCGASDYTAIIREWLVQFTRETGLQDILAVGGHGLWWTQNSLKFRPSITDLGNSFVWIDLLAAINHQLRPTSIVVDGDYQPVIHLVDQIFSSRPIKILAPTKTQTREVIRPTLKPALLVVRALIGCIYLIYSTIRRPEICFLTATNLLRRVATGSSQTLRDIYLDDVAKALNVQGWRTVMVETHDWNASWKGLWIRGFFFPNDIVFLMSSPHLSKLGIHQSIVRKWRSKWVEVQPRLAPQLQYRGYDISPMAMPTLKQQFTHMAPYFEIMTRMWTLIFRVWRPKLLFINCFYMLTSTSAIIAARALNILTIEQQHGVIGANHMAYLVPQQLEPKTRYPLCDKMIVWGDYTKRLLLGTGVYNPEDLGVCGFPRIDMLLSKLPPKSQTLAELDIPADAKVALYTSGVVGRNLWSTVLRGIQNGAGFPDLYWIIKLHPRDKTRQQWEAAINSQKIQHVVVVENEFDFYALLAASDVHVSFISTTLIEAAILGVPNLGVTIPHIPDPVGYLEAQAFLPVRPDQIGPEVCTFLTDINRQRILQKKQREFARDWCLHDGQAVQRIVRFVESNLTN